MSVDGDSGSGDVIADEDVDHECGYDASASLSLERSVQKLRKLAHRVLPIDRHTDASLCHHDTG